MTRHTIDIDRDLLLECQQALRTPALSETVREALRFYVAQREPKLAHEGSKARMDPTTKP